MGNFGSILCSNNKMIPTLPDNYFKIGYLGTTTDYILNTDQGRQAAQSVSISGKCIAIIAVLSTGAQYFGPGQAITAFPNAVYNVTLDPNRGLVHTPVRGTTTTTLGGPDIVCPQVILTADEEAAIAKEYGFGSWDELLKSNLNASTEL